MRTALTFAGRRGRRFVAPICLAIAILSPAIAVAPATASPAPAAQASGPYWVRVKGDDVMLRSGQSVESAYPIARLRAGQPLKVLGTEFGWAKVVAVGPAFSEAYGFVDSRGAAVPSADGTTLTVNGKTPILAPNMNANFAPDKSWRQLGVAEQGESLPILRTVQGANGVTYFAVRLPQRVVVFVAEQFVEPITQSDADAIEAALAGTAPMPATPTPEPTPAPAGDPPATPAPAAGPATPAATPPATAPAAVPAQPEGTTPAAANPAPPPPGTVTNNPPVDDAKPAPETASEAAARQAREAAEQRAREAQLSRVTYQDLEAIWARVRHEPTESAELAALRERYLALAADGAAGPSTRTLALARAEQIGMKMEVQEQLLEISRLQSARGERKQFAADLEIALLKRRPYDAVGRLMASTVYDGNKLPLLYKLAAPIDGHTIAYVLPGPGTRPSEALGLVVGLKGKRSYDTTLRIDVIAPELIEPLDIVTSVSTSPAN